MENSLFFLEYNHMKHLSTTKKIGIVLLAILLIAFYTLALSNLLM
jgi:hypothetical protein